MTRSGAKWPRKRPRGARFGKITRGGRGIIVVYADAVDVVGAPSFYITGLAKVERIGEGTLRFTFYEEVDGEKRVVLRTIWDLKNWVETGHPTLLDARNVVVNALTGDGQRSRKEAH